MNQADLPPHWKVMRLKEIASVKYGKAKPEQPGSIPVVGSSGVYAWASSALIDFPTLVIGRKGTAGMVWLQEQPCWPSDTTFYLEWKTKTIELRFVYYFLLAHPLSGEHARTTLPSLQRQDLEDCVLSLPPLPEQRAIAQALRAVQEAKEARRREAALERERKAGLMQQLFTHGTRGEPRKQTEIGEIPESWRVVRLGEAFRFTRKPKELRYSDFERLPFVPMDLLPVGSLYFDRFILKSPDELTSGTYFERGDVLLAKITPSFENGKQGIIENLPTDFGIATTEVIPIQGVAGMSDKLFLFYYLLRQDVRAELAGRMEGSTGRQRLSKSTLETLQIPLPPLAEQYEIAGTLQACDAKIAALEQEAAVLDELFRAMLEELMTGRLSAVPLMGAEGSP